MGVSGGEFPFQKSTGRGRQIVEIVSSLIKEVESGGGSDCALVAAGKIHEVGREFALSLKAYSASEGNSEAIVRTAIVYLKIGDPGRALATIKAFTDKEPEFRFADISGRPLSARTILGDAYRANGDLAAAREAYTAALELVPEDSHSAAQLARMHLADNSVDEAVKLSERFFEDDEMSALHATTRLLANDPNRLPALVGVVNDVTRKFSDVR